MSFPEAIFSFVFGDGDPNVGLQRRLYQELAAYIRCVLGAYYVVCAALRLGALWLLLIRWFMMRYTEILRTRKPLLNVSTKDDNKKHVIPPPPPSAALGAA